MEVPSNDLVWPSIQVEMIQTPESMIKHLRKKIVSTDIPGANRLTVAPKLEKSALVSVISDAPTTIASCTSAGLERDVSSFEFPAATTTVMPEEINWQVIVSVNVMA
jgi:hypothetical protein